MDRIRRKWWFVVPVAFLTVGSAFWLFQALGFPDPLRSYSFARLVLFVVAMHSFGRLYSWGIWAGLLWFAPTTLGEKPLNSWHSSDWTRRK